MSVFTFEIEWHGSRESALEELTDLQEALVSYSPAARLRRRGTRRLRGEVLIEESPGSTLGGITDEMLDFCRSTHATWVLLSAKET